MGGHALYQNIGDNAIGIGYYAGYQNTGDNQSTIGYYAGYQNTGNNQSVLGYKAGYANSSVGQTAMGYQAGLSQSGIYQTVLGYNAGSNNTGQYQTAVGLSAGESNTGSRVLGFGHNATKLNTADDIIAIGYQAGLSNATANQLIINQANLNATPIILGDLSTLALTFGGTVKVSSFGNSPGNFITHDSGTLQERTASEVLSDIGATDSLFNHRTETDPIFSAWDKSTGISMTESQISDFGSRLWGI